jgi:glycosyltransferase involved in cell wall biosynthesis
MKVFQTIHKYAPHIPQFEKKHGITDDTRLTFEELRHLLVHDGYASSYVLLPALQNKSAEFFFTLWDYERLQRLWATEHGLKTDDLDTIKLAQIEWFKPDVFYNMSPFMDRQFIELVKIARIQCKTVCWNGIIQPRPMTFPLYDAHLTLHQPFVSYWQKLGLKAFEFQPGVPASWDYDSTSRPIDVLFYGQYFEGMFSDRNRIIDQLVSLKKKSKLRIDIHLQFKPGKRVLFKVPKFEIKQTSYPSRLVRISSKPPIYGQELYSTISQSKIVVNAYTNDNKDYKSNMRLFEAMGNGAFLVSERGTYPSGLIPDVDFYTYQGFDELREKVEYILSDWEVHQKKAFDAAQKIRSYFSKEKQWARFQEIVSSL